MKMIHTGAAMMAVMTSLAGTPVVKDSSVVMTQDPNSHKVTIAYTLEDAPAIVTVDIQTNGVSIGGSNLWYFSGDVNKLVDVGDRVMTWRPNRAWPNHLLADGVTAVVTAWATNTPPDYMVVSLTAAKTVRFYANAESIPGGVTNDLCKTENLVMRKCPAANVEWRMGSPSTEVGRSSSGSTETARYVTLSSDYYIGVYEITQRQYELMMDARPAYYKLDADYATRPVESVSYEKLRGTTDKGYNWPETGHKVVSNGFIDKLRKFSGLEGFDLPTEAQWEFACRAGCGATYNNGSDLEDEDVARFDALDEIARYKGNGGCLADGSTPPANSTIANGSTKVGQLKPNAWGLYDMHGNVWEACLDWYEKNPTMIADPNKGPTSGTSGTSRLKRGGSWQSAPPSCRAAFRSEMTSSASVQNLGFRLACTLENIE